jgi:hypothetical protein
MLARRQVHVPRDHRGWVLEFADGTSGLVYRETSAPRSRAADPCVLVVCFRLRWVHGRGHRWFRVESLLNTPLFVGFPGFVSKLWIAHDAHEVYRGVYEWDGAGRAEQYARSLRHVLALVSEPGSIAHHVSPRMRRDALLHQDRQPRRPSGTGEWWRVVAARPGGTDDLRSRDVSYQLRPSTGTSGPVDPGLATLPCRR